MHIYNNTLSYSVYFLVNHAVNIRLSRISPFEEMFSVGFLELIILLGL